MIIHTYRKINKRERATIKINIKLPKVAGLNLKIVGYVSLTNDDDVKIAAYILRINTTSVLIFAEGKCRGEYAGPWKSSYLQFYHSATQDKDAILYDVDSLELINIEEQTLKKLKTLHKSVSRRHKKKHKVESLLSFQDLVNIYLQQNNRCYYTKLLMEPIFDAKNPLSFTIDRMDSSVGYTKDNTVFCCWFVNCAKSIWNLKTILPYWKTLVDNLSE